MKRKHMIVLAVVVLTIALVSGGIAVLISSVEKSRNQIASIQIKDVDMQKAQNGIFKGSYNTFLVSAEVNVTLKDHRITDIKITKHYNGRGSAAEKITDKVVEAQSLEVDVISGATSSSKVILKAIENALVSATDKN